MCAYKWLRNLCLDVEKLVYVYLAHKEHCPIILGSATPSLESLYNAGFGENKQSKFTKRTAKIRKTKSKKAKYF